MMEQEKYLVLRKEFESNLAASLPEAERNRILAKFTSDMADIIAETKKKMLQSEIAAKDLEDLNEFITKLENDKKIYTANQKSQTGSGTREIHIKGGDTRFIVPILIVVAVFILGALVIFFRTH